MSETKKKWQKPALSQVIYGVFSAVAAVLLAIGLYQMVMTQNVKARVVFEAFMKGFGVWAVVVYLVGWVSSTVLFHQERKKEKAAKAAK